MKAFSLFAIFFIMFSYNVSASTEEVELEYLNIDDIQAISSDSYSPGKNPSIIVLNNDRVLNVFEGQTTDYLWYRIGEYKEGLIHWSSESHQYSEGKEPTLTVLDNGKILEMHEHISDGSITYNIGEYVNGKIIWRSVDNKYITEGEKPSVVVLDSGEIITFYTQKNNEKLMYIIGEYEDNKIKLTSQVAVSSLAKKSYNRDISILDSGEILITQESENDEMYYLLGTYNGGSTINWLSTSWEKYSPGKNPSLTILDNGQILNVFEDQTTDYLWYRLGEFKDGDIDWYSEAVQYSSGENPFVTTLDNGEIIGLREINDDMYYSIGNYDNEKIDWVHSPSPIGDTDTRYSWGKDPTLDVMDNGIVVSIKSENHNLGYQLGEYYNGKMYWTKPVNYDTGDNPSVTVLSNGDILEVHQYTNFWYEKNLYYNLGRYEDGKINWYSIGNKYDSGTNASVVSLKNNKVMEVHDGGALSQTYYNLGRYEDGKINWYDIGNMYNTTGDKPNITYLTTGQVLETHTRGNSELYYKIAGNVDNTPSWNATHLYEYNGKGPVSIQLSNHYVLTMFEGTTGSDNRIWSRTGIPSTSEMSWVTNTYTYDGFKGKNNDVVQLKNDILLNVHEDVNSNGLDYVLGEWNWESRKVEWLVN